LHLSEAIRALNTTFIENTIRKDCLLTRISQIKFMKTILTILFASLMLLSCSKEEHPRVEYKVSSSGSALIAYTMVTSSVRQETVSGSWDVSFKHTKGGNVFLSAINTGIGTTSISVYVNNELLHTETTQIPGGLIEISEVLP
jgi:PBP1b-binding outer membrane lipoprotein LpoB